MAKAKKRRSPNGAKTAILAKVQLKILEKLSEQGLFNDCGFLGTEYYQMRNDLLEVIGE